MIIAYNKDGHTVITQDKISNIELMNRELPEENRLVIFEGNIFPPEGKKLFEGRLIDKTEKEKILSSELKLSDIQSTVIDSINKLCASKIVSGFESAALGEFYIYDSQDVDQINLIGAVAAGGSVLYKCKNKASSVIEFVSHSNTQIKKVLGDGASRKITLLQNCYLLKQGLLALNDYDSIVGFDISQGWI